MRNESTNVRKKRVNAFMDGDEGRDRCYVRMIRRRRYEADRATYDDENPEDEKDEIGSL